MMMLEGIRGRSQQRRHLFIFVCLLTDEIEFAAYSLLIKLTSPFCLELDRWSLKTYKEKRKILVSDLS